MATLEASQFLNWLLQDRNGDNYLKVGSDWPQLALAEGFDPDQIRSELASVGNTAEGSIGFDDLLTASSTDVGQLRTWINTVLITLQATDQQLLELAGGSQDGAMFHDSVHSMDQGVRDRLKQRAKQRVAAEAMGLYAEHGTETWTSSEPETQNHKKFDPNQITYTIDGNRIDGSLSEKNSSQNSYYYGHGNTYTWQGKNWTINFNTPGQGKSYTTTEYKNTWGNLYTGRVSKNGTSFHVKFQFNITETGKIINGVAGGYEFSTLKGILQPRVQKRDDNILSQMAEKFEPTLQPALESDYKSAQAHAHALVNSHSHLINRDRHLISRNKDLILNDPKLTQNKQINAARDLINLYNNIHLNGMTLREKNQLFIASSVYIRASKKDRNQTTLLTKELKKSVGKSVETQKENIIRKDKEDLIIDQKQLAGLTYKAKLKDKLKMDIQALDGRETIDTFQESKGMTAESVREHTEVLSYSGKKLDRHDWLELEYQGSNGSEVWVNKEYGWNSSDGSFIQYNVNIFPKNNSGEKSINVYWNLTNHQVFEYSIYNDSNDKKIYLKTNNLKKIQKADQSSLQTLKDFQDQIGHSVKQLNKQLNNLWSNDLNRWQRKEILDSKTVQALQSKSKSNDVQQFKSFRVKLSKLDTINIGNLSKTQKLELYVADKNIHRDASSKIAAIQQEIKSIHADLVNKINTIEATTKKNESFDERLELHTYNQLSKNWSKDGSETVANNTPKNHKKWDPTQVTYSYNGKIDGRRINGSLSAKAGKTSTTYTYTGSKYTGSLTVTDWKDTWKNPQTTQATATGSFRKNNQTTSHSITLVYGQHDLLKSKLTISTKSGKNTITKNMTLDSLEKKKEEQLQKERLSANKKLHAEYNSITTDRSKLALQEKKDISSRFDPIVAKEIQHAKTIKTLVDRIDIQSLTKRQINNLFFVDVLLENKIKNHHRYIHEQRKEFNHRLTVKKNSLAHKASQQIIDNRKTRINKIAKKKSNNLLASLKKGSSINTTKSETQVNKNTTYDTWTLTYKFKGFSATFWYSNSWKISGPGAFPPRETLYGGFTTQKNGKSGIIVDLMSNTFTGRPQLININSDKNVHFKDPFAGIREQKRDQANHDYQIAAATISYFKTMSIVRNYLESKYAKVSKLSQILVSHKYFIEALNLDVQDLRSEKFSSRSLGFQIRAVLLEHSIKDSIKDFLRAPAANVRANHKTALHDFKLVHNIFKHGSPKGSEHVSLVQFGKTIRYNQTHVSKHQAKVKSKDYTFIHEDSILINVYAKLREGLYEIEKQALKSGLKTYDEAIAKGDTKTQAKKLADQSILKTLITEDKDAIKLHKAISDRIESSRKIQHLLFTPFGLLNKSTGAAATEKFVLIAFLHVPVEIPDVILYKELKMCNKILKDQQDRFGSIARMQAYYARLTWINKLTISYNSKQLVWTANHTVVTHHGLWYKLKHGVVDMFKDTLSFFKDIFTGHFGAAWHVFKKMLVGEYKAVADVLKRTVGFLEHAVVAVCRSVEHWILNPLFSWIPGFSKVEGILNSTVLVAGKIINTLGKGLLKLPAHLVKDFSKLGMQVFTMWKNIFTGNFTIKGEWDAIGRDTKGPRHLAKKLLRLTWNLDHFRYKKVYKHVKGNIHDISEVLGAFEKKTLFKKTMQSEKHFMHLRRMAKKDTFGFVKSPRQVFSQRHQKFLDEVQHKIDQTNQYVEFSAKHPKLATVADAKKSLKKWEDEQKTLLQNQFDQLTKQKQVTVLSKLKSGSYTRQQESTYLKKDLKKEYPNKLKNVQHFSFDTYSKKVETKVQDSVQESIHNAMQARGALHVFGYMMPTIKKWTKTTEERNIKRTRWMAKHQNLMFDLVVAQKARSTYVSALLNEQHKINADWTSWGKSDTKMIKNLLEITLLPKMTITHNPLVITVVSTSSHIGSKGKSTLNNYFKANQTGKHLFEKIMWGLAIVKYTQSHGLSSAKFISPLRAWGDVTSKQHSILVHQEKSPWFKKSKSFFNLSSNHYSWITKDERKAKILRKMAVQEYYVDFILNMPVKEIIGFKNNYIKGEFMNGVYASTDLRSLQQVLKFDSINKANQNYKNWLNHAKKYNKIFLSDYGSVKTMQQQNHDLDVADVLLAFAPQTTSTPSGAGTSGSSSNSSSSSSSTDSSKAANQSGDSTKKPRSVNLMMLYQQSKMIKHMLHKSHDSEDVEHAEKEAETKAESTTETKAEIKVETKVDAVSSETTSELKTDLVTDASSMDAETESQLLDLWKSWTNEEGRDVMHRVDTKVDQTIDHDIDTELDDVKTELIDNVVPEVDNAADDYMEQFFGLLGDDVTIVTENVENAVMDAIVEDEALAVGM